MATLHRCNTTNKTQTTHKQHTNTTQTRYKENITEHHNNTPDRLVQLLIAVALILIRRVILLTKLAGLETFVSASDDCLTRTLLSLNSVRRNDDLAGDKFLQSYCDEHFYFNMTNYLFVQTNSS